VSTYIYALIDPRNSEVRYVGATLNVGKRVARHLRDRFGSGKSLRACWLRDLEQSGAMPEWYVLETVPRWAASDAERLWIELFCAFGCQLTNGTDGGDNLPTAAQRRRMSILLAGRPSQRRGRRFPPRDPERISNAHKGIRPSKKTIEKMRRARKAYWRKHPDFRHSEATKARMRAGQARRRGLS